MRKLTIPLLAISLLLVFGCASKPQTHAQATIETVHNPYFADASRDYVYRTKIFVYGHELSGVLIAKKINDSVHRAVLTTDFGNTLIDFEIGQKSFRMRSIVDDLDRKILINTLRDDFRLLFRHEFKASASAKNAPDPDKIYECVEGKAVYRIGFSGKRLVSVSAGNRKKDKVTIGFHTENDTFADKIEMRHFNMELRIEMEHFNR